MKSVTFKTLFVLIIQSIAASCGNAGKEDENKGLKDYYSSYFPMGVAVYPAALEGPEGKLITTHFKSMTPENVLKMGPVHPEENHYNWAPADQIVDFARKNNLMLRGHALCWHRQVPDWIFKDSEGVQVSKEILIERLKTHITDVVSRYQDDIYAWDVVNEAISDKKDEFYRPSLWYQICGEAFISKAFEFAREADSDVQLFYNDYEVINPVKREKIVKLVKQLKASGTPIDGVGIQGHWSVYEPSEQVLRETIEAFVGLGLKVQITELDVSIYPKEHSRREKRPTDSDEFTDELKQMQADQYEMIFRVLRDYKDDINAVTFWNISDYYSWLDNFPVTGRKDYPLLFDETFKPKAAYQRVVDF